MRRKPIQIRIDPEELETHKAFVQAVRKHTGMNFRNWFTRMEQRELARFERHAAQRRDGT